MKSILLAALVATASASPQNASTAEHYWDAWPQERFVQSAAPCIRPAELEENLQSLAQQHPDSLILEEAGRSFQNRPINLLTLGRGPRKVMLWSQMHGDEPSATPALLDLADYLLRHAEEPRIRQILDELTLLIVPMLNPDGSEVYDRRTAQGIDMNRDALNLATPEGRLLKRLRDEHEPFLGFNLHDQNRRTAVGDTGILATNAVLAVSGDPEGTVTPGRLRAKRACSAIVHALAPFMPGGMARYDEDWSPRAFGDNITAWGTPVVLIESGGLPPGRDFTELTRLNFVALLTALGELARNDLADYDPQVYEDLLRNQGDSWVDVAVRGGHLLQPGTSVPYRTDLAINLFRSDQQAAGCAPDEVAQSRIMDVGDARFLGAGSFVEAAGSLVLAPFTARVEGWKARRWLTAEATQRLARLGVETVHWVVPGKRREAAEKIARKLAGPNRARIEIATEAPETWIVLDGPPPERLSSRSLDHVLEALGGKHWRKARKNGSVFEALTRLSAPEDGAAPWPALRRGAPASFLIVGPAGEDGRDLEDAELQGVWLNGVEVEGP